MDSCGLFLFGGFLSFFLYLLVVVAVVVVKLLFFRVLFAIPFSCSFVVDMLVLCFVFDCSGAVPALVQYPLQLSGVRKRMRKGAGKDPETLAHERFQQGCDANIGGYGFLKLFQKS